MITITNSRTLKRRNMKLPSYILGLLDLDKANKVKVIQLCQGHKPDSAKHLNCHKFWTNGLTYVNMVSKWRANRESHLIRCMYTLISYRFHYIKAYSLQWEGFLAFNDLGCKRNVTWTKDHWWRYHLAYNFRFSKLKFLKL